jgi:hypothetical protein
MLIGKVQRVRVDPGNSTGHASITTTERYLSSRQDLVNAPNDRIGLRRRED